MINKSSNLKRNLLFFTFNLIFIFSFSQNVSLGIQADNGGIVEVGNTIFLRIFIRNTSPTPAVAAYRLQPLFFIPVIFSVEDDGHVLPAGWAFLSKDAGSFRLTNGTGTIPPLTTREILIKIKGLSIGGPSVVQGNLFFSNGQPPGTTSGVLNGNNTSDDKGSVNITVVTTLPVTLTDFNANMVNCQALLNWTTKTEQNSDYFNLEKSVDVAGAGHWTSIGSLKAAGTSFREINYSFVDKSPSLDAGLVFYRLKTIDKDGSFSYSRIVRLQNNCLHRQIITYPNPVINGKMFIDVGTLSGSELILMNSSGQSVQNQKLTSGINILNIRNISAGIYLILVKNDSGILHTAKVFVR